MLIRRKLSKISLEVVAIGEKKVASLENRLSRISIVAIFGGGVTDPDAASITAEAGPLCTVTNTIFDSPNIVFSSRAVKGPSPRLREFTAQHPTH